MLKIAHRGFSDRYKDNTLEAFYGAIQYGFDMIELDIQLCKSGEIVIYHDTHINNKLVIDCTLDELKKIDKDIITLSTFFKKISSYDIKVFLDIKGYSRIVYPLVRLIKKHLYYIYVPNIYISSFNLKTIERLKTFRIPFKLGVTLGNLFTENQLEQIIKDINYVCIDWTVLDRKTVEYIKNKNVLVFSCTCENMAIYNEMKEYDIDGIVSNILI